MKLPGTTPDDDYATDFERSIRQVLASPHYDHAIAHIVAAHNRILIARNQVYMQQIEDIGTRLETNMHKITKALKRVYPELAELTLDPLTTEGTGATTEPRPDKPEATQ